MNEQKSLLTRLGETLDQYRAERRGTAQERMPSGRAGWLHRLLPAPGNVIFTLVMIALLVAAQSVGAIPLRNTQYAVPSSTATIAYQGRLANAAGEPLSGTYPMIFRLYTVATGGTPLWTEQWTGSNSVRVSDGLFNVMLGSLNAIRQQDIAGHDQLWLGITVGTDDEMTPRVQLGSVPFAVQALTVPDGSVTTAKIANGAVTQAKLGADVSLVPPDGSITTAKIADGAVTTVKLNVNNGLDVTGNLTVTRDIQVGSNVDMGGNNYGKVVFQYSSGFIQLRSARSGVTGGHALAIDLQDDDRSVFEIVRQAVGPKAMIKANGDFWAAGTKAALIQTETFGQRKLFAAESPEVRFFDEGLARLHNGIARVELDPVFLETIEGEYLVHVTPYGDASLYVAEIGHDYFVVKARAGDPDVAFAWRLSATRKGYAGVRLEEAR